MIKWKISIDTNKYVWIIYKGIEPTYIIDLYISGKNEKCASKNTIKFLKDLAFIASNGNIDNSYTLHQYRESAIEYVGRGWSFTAGNKLGITLTVMKYSDDEEM